MDCQVLLSQIETPDLLDSFRGLCGRKWEQI